MDSIRLIEAYYMFSEQILTYLENEITFIENDPSVWG